MEKVLLNRWFSNSKSFCVLIGCVQVFIGLLISLVVPLSLDNYWESYLFAIISGFTSGLMLCIVFYSLKTLDISRVYSLLSSYPIFAAILASLILNEKLEFPGDKSISHRALIMGSLSSGLSKIYNLNLAQDIQH